jgi:hypothetical protein
MPVSGFLRYGCDAPLKLRGGACGGARIALQRRLRLKALSERLGKKNSPAKIIMPNNNKREQQQRLAHLR